MAKCSRATGPHAAVRDAARSGSARTLRIASASGPAATGGQKACSGAAQEVLIIAEVGRHDRAAGGEIDGDLALDGIILTTGKSRVDQDVGPPRQRDDLIGGLAGQDDQPLAVSPSWAR